jgi:hypothetical protein
LILILTEIIPKTLGANYSKSLVGFASKTINGMILITYPLVVVSSILTKILSKNKTEFTTSREEVSALASIGTEEGIFAENENCTQETSFDVTIVNNFSNVQNCESYILPSPEIGNFFTEPAGEGTLIPNGTEIFSTTTLYYYVETTVLPNCTNDFSFIVTIVPFPEVSTPDDLSICVTESPYVLPVLEYGAYFTQPERGGTQLFPGDQISETTTLYLFLNYFLFLFPITISRYSWRFLFKIASIKGFMSL